MLSSSEAKTYVSNILSTSLYTTDDFDVAQTLIKKYNLNILDISLTWARNAETELDLKLGMFVKSFTVNSAMLIVAGVDYAYFAPYTHRNSLFNSIAHLSLYGLAEGSIEQKACREALKIMSFNYDFQVKYPRDHSARNNYVTQLLHLGLTFDCFKNFDVALLREVWQQNIKGTSNIFELFAVRLINAGWKPVALDLHCKADDPQLLAIAQQDNFEALLAMYKLVHEHGFILPEDVADIYKKNLAKKINSRGLSAEEFFILARTMQKQQDLPMAAKLYSNSIAIHDHTLSMVNLGYMYEQQHDYARAKELYVRAAKKNDPLAIEHLKDEIFKTEQRRPRSMSSRWPTFQ